MFAERIKYITTKYCLTHIVKDMDDNEIYHFICEYFLGKRDVNVSKWSDEEFRVHLGCNYFLSTEDFEEICDMLRLKAEEIFYK
jgi:hypothetical protein